MGDPQAERARRRALSASRQVARGRRQAVSATYASQLTGRDGSAAAARANAPAAGVLSNAPAESSEARYRGVYQDLRRRDPGRAIFRPQDQSAEEVLGPSAAEPGALGPHVQHYEDTGSVERFASRRVDGEESGSESSPLYRVGVGERVVIPVEPGTDPRVVSTEFDHCGGTVIRGRAPDGRTVLLMGHVAAEDDRGHWARVQEDVAWMAGHGVTELEVVAVVHPRAQGESDGEVDAAAFYGFPSQEQASEALGGAVHRVEVVRRSGDADAQIVADSQGTAVLAGDYDDDARVVRAVPGASAPAPPAALPRQRGPAHTELRAVEMLDAPAASTPAAETPDAEPAESPRRRVRRAPSGATQVEDAVVRAPRRPIEPPRVDAPELQAPPAPSAPPADEEPVDLEFRDSPRRSPEEAEDAPAPVALHPDGVDVNWETPGGTRRQAGARVNRQGGEVSYASTARDAGGRHPEENERRVSLGLSVQQGADGIEGADLTLGAGLGPVSGSLSAGATYHAGRPRQQSDGSFRVSWRVEVRAGSSLGRQFSRMGVSVGANGAMTREGVEVFRAGGPEHALEAARAYQESFQELDARTVADRFFSMATMAQGTVEWWSQAEVGTQRTVRVSLSVTPSLSGRVMSVLPVSVGVPVQGKAHASVSKSGANAVSVTQHFEVEVAAELGVGGPVAVRGGMGLVDNGYIYRVDLTYSVSLDRGADAFRHFLAREALLHDEQDGVRYTGQRVERGPLETNAVEVPLLGELSGRDSLTTITSTTRAEDGSETESTAYRVNHDFTGNAVDGAYSRRNMQFDAPSAENQAYEFQLDVHDTEAAHHSGNWVVSQQFSQVQMREFHRRYLAHRRNSGLDDAAGLTCYDRAYRSLRDVPVTEAGNAARARIIGELVRADGERAIRLIRSHLGAASGSPSVRLYGRDGEDTVFLSSSAEADFARRIGAYRQAMDSAERQSTRVDTALGGRIRADLADLERRIVALQDRSRYRDLPVSRDELLARWRGLAGQLRALTGRIEAQGNDDLLDRLSEAGRDATYAATDEQGRMATAQSWAQQERDEVVAHRQRWGQMSGGVRDEEARLSGGLESRTEGAWSASETAFRAATSARQEGESALEGARDGDTGDELTTRRQLRSAQAAFERAAFSYRQAAQLFTDLDELYDRIGTQSTQQTLGTAASEPGPSPRDSSPPTPARRRPAAARQARRRRRPRAQPTRRSGGEGRASETGSANATPADFQWASLRPHIRRRQGIAALRDPFAWDETPTDVGHGLVVRIVNVRFLPGVGAAEGHTVDRLRLTLRVVRPGEHQTLTMVSGAYRPSGELNVLDANQIPLQAGRRFQIDVN